MDNILKYDPASKKLNIVLGMPIGKIGDPQAEREVISHYWAEQFKEHLPKEDLLQMVKQGNAHIGQFVQRTLRC